MIYKFLDFLRMYVYMYAVIEYLFYFDFLFAYITDFI